MHCGLGGPGAQACKDALDACLADTSQDAATCAATAKSCMDAVIAANFKAHCDHQVERCKQCAPDQTVCDDLAAKCAAGPMLPAAP